VTAEPLLTARQVADLLGFAAGTVLDKFERGELPGFKLPGGAVRFRASELEAWLDGCRRGPEVQAGAGGEAPTAPRMRPPAGVVSAMPTVRLGGEEHA